MNTTENNTKIAKFLGYEITEGSQGKGITRQGQHISLNKLKFHNDWNWLIIAIDNIYDRSEYLDYCDSLGQFASEGVRVNTKFISSTYEDVLNFIDWAQTK